MYSYSYTYTRLFFDTKLDSPQPANDDDKKKKSVSHGSNRQVSDDKVEKQSHRPREGIYTHNLKKILVKDEKIK